MTLVKFADVVRLNTDRTADPASAGIDRFVGLEHIEPENLHIRSWGLVADGTTFTSTFKRGQVLFGKRRAYQRKVAVADFDGVCSSDIYVFESKDPNVLLPELVPFICQSEGFYDYAVKTSAGSLSPRTNWSHLANYEFPLPPVDEQRRIADLLWAADDVISSYQELLEKQLELQFILMSDLLSAKHWNKKAKSTRFGQIPENWEIQKISEIAQVDYGISESVANNTDPSIGWSILTGANITLDGTIDQFKTNYIKPPTKEGFILKKGDILLNWRSGSPEHVGKAAIFDLDGDFTYASFILRIRVNESMNNVFLHRLLNFMRKNKLFGSSTSQQINFKMNATQFREVEVVVPPIDEQLEIVEIFENWKNATDALVAHIESSKQVKQNLLNKFLA
jgi:type I restriction enzyme S subunit